MGLQPANDEFLASCLLQNLQNRLKTQIQVPNSRRDGSPVISPDPCRSYLERQAQVAALKQNLDRLLTRQNEIPGQIETLRKALVPSSTPSTALPPFKQLTLQFLYIPTVALMGICVKLGATTCSLRS